MKQQLKLEIKQLMAENYLFRNNDKALILEVWSSHGLKLNTLQIEQFKNVPDAQSIVRERRRWSKTYRANPIVEAHRFRNYQRELEDKSNGKWFDKIMKRRGI